MVLSRLKLALLMVIIGIAPLEFLSLQLPLLDLLLQEVNLPWLQLRQGLLNSLLSWPLLWSLLLLSVLLSNSVFSSKC